MREIDAFGVEITRGLPAALVDLALSNETFHWQQLCSERSHEAAEVIHEDSFPLLYSH